MHISVFFVFVEYVPAHMPLVLSAYYQTHDSMQLPLLLKDITGRMTFKCSVTNWHGGRMTSVWGDP